MDVNVLPSINKGSLLLLYFLITSTEVIRKIQVQVQSQVQQKTTYIHTSFFRCSPRGFSATCLQQMQGSVVEGLSQTATSGSQCFFLSETLSCALS